MAGWRAEGTGVSDLQALLQTLLQRLDAVANDQKAILRRLDDQARGLSAGDRSALELLVPALRALRRDTPITAAQIVEMAPTASGHAGEVLRDALVTFRGVDPNKALGRMLNRADGLSFGQWQLRVVPAARAKDPARYVVVPGLGARKPGLDSSTTF